MSKIKRRGGVFSFAEVMENSIRIGRRRHIRVISSLLLLGKAFMTVEYMGRTLGPEDFSGYGLYGPY